ncbi:MAG TPA: hypothetical protein VFF52_21500, partial [Isosphaeraceae bacterium]|nr:hypothetical protein [Isosphaeraceae bacterium]
MRPGSAFDVAWGGPYDLVLLTNFLHHFDQPTRAQVAAQAHAALAPGGRALTRDFMPEPDRITPPSTASFAPVMLATTARGDASTFAEYQARFARAGSRAANSTPSRRPRNRRWWRIWGKRHEGPRRRHLVAVVEAGMSSQWPPKSVGVDGQATVGMR